MILDLLVTKTDDGFNAEVPSIKGCDSWAHDEDSAIESVLETASFYLKVESKKLKIDKARRSGETTIYKIIFNK